MVNIMDKAIAESLEIWNSCASLPMVEELWDGSLNKERFKTYLIEDSLYLREYARGYAYAMTKAKTMEDMRFFYSVLGFVNENETSVRIQGLNNLGLTEDEIEEYIPAHFNTAYIDHMLQYCKNGTIKEAVMALLPCMLSYHYVFCKQKEKAPCGKQYENLVEEYISLAYKNDCDTWISYANFLCKNITDEEERILIEIFKISSQHEYFFWTGCYQKEITV